MARRWSRFFFAALVISAFAETQGSAQAQDISDPLAYPFGMELGVGYLHAGTDIATIWGDGFSVEMAFGYRPWRTFGFTLGGVYGSTSISDVMRNKVHIYAPSTGNYSTSESSGGDYYQLLLGPTYYVPLFQSDFVLSLGAGGSYYGSSEAGMGDIEDYEPRWTFGWGYYLEAGITRHVPTGFGPLTYGLNARYSALRSRVNDFYYDRVYGAMSYDQIPHVYVWDRRLQLTLSVGLEL